MSEIMVDFEFDEKLTKCIVCESGEIKDHLTDYKKINISKCSNCGFQFMNPQYSDNYLSLYYSSYTNDENFEYWHQALMYGHGFYLSLIERYASVGKMLDIGCGNGHLLEAAKLRGWDVCGYDVDEISTESVAQRLKIEVKSGGFFDALSEKKSEYNLITMHQVLEHLKDPDMYLDKMHSLLTDDGYIFVAVPNIRSIGNRLKFFMEKIGLKKNNIGKYYDTSHHVLYFEPATLVALLSKHGFDVVYQRNGHKTRPKQSGFKRFFMRNFTDHLFAKSTFFVIAKKR